MIDSFTFLERYPIFEGISEDTIDDEITIAYNQLSGWKEPYLTKAVGLLVAHTLRLEHGDTIKLGASLRSIEEGTEIKNDLVDLSLPYFKQTIYGQQYLNLRKQVQGLSMFVV